MQTLRCWLMQRESPGPYFNKLLSLTSQRREILSLTGDSEVPLSVSMFTCFLSSHRWGRLDSQHHPPALMSNNCVFRKKNKQKRFPPHWRTNTIISLLLDNINEPKGENNQEDKEQLICGTKITNLKQFLKEMHGCTE